jgi:hypothetical protein
MASNISHINFYRSPAVSVNARSTAAGADFLTPLVHQNGRVIQAETKTATQLNPPPHGEGFYPPKPEDASINAIGNSVLGNSNPDDGNSVDDFDVLDRAIRDYVFGHSDPLPSKSNKNI